MSRPVPHQVTLVAFAQSEGLTVVADIVETSRKNAPFFARRFYRDPTVTAIAAARPVAPGDLPSTIWDKLVPRTINR